jgi:hypothetical protein
MRLFSVPDFKVAKAEILGVPTAGESSWLTVKAYSYILLSAFFYEGLIT